LSIEKIGLKLGAILTLNSSIANKIMAVNCSSKSVEETKDRKAKEWRLID
jgi:hypothetical protein